MKELSLLHQYVLRPIGALFLNASYSLPGSLSDDDAKKVYRMARQNDLAPITDYILETQGILTSESPVFPAFQKARRLSVFRTEGQQYILQTAGKILSSRKIPYVPLKGAVIRSLYPEPWMRTSCDVDVLVKPEDFQRAVIALQEEAGVTETSKTEHDVSLGFSNGEKVELHFTLIEESKIMRAAKTLKDVWPVVEFGTEDPYEGTLPDDVFYYYHIAHLAKHFEIDGCGIRPVLDAWLLNRLPAFDKAKRDALLERGGLKHFADCVEKLGRYWFEGEEADETVLELERFILAGRSEGSKHNEAMAGAGLEKSRLKQTWKRAFLPYRMLKLQYPALEGHPLRTPLYQVRRLNDAWRKKRGTVKQETGIIWGTKSTERKQIRKLFDDLGL